MRLSAYFNFNKKYGRIETNNQDSIVLKKGTVLSFNISSSFNVETFNGTKSIYLYSNPNWVGKNEFNLSLGCFVMAVISLLSMTLVFVKQKLYPRIDLKDKYF